MPLQNMNIMLSNAKDGGYAVGAFNILDYNSTKAVVQAAAFSRMCSPQAEPRPMTCVSPTLARLT